MQKPQSLRQRSADMACARAPNIKAIETRFGAPRIANFALADRLGALAVDAWAGPGLSLIRPPARSETDGGRFGFQQARGRNRSGARHAQPSPDQACDRPRSSTRLGRAAVRMDRVESFIASPPASREPLAHEPRRPRLGATHAFSRRPLFALLARSQS